MLPLIKGKTYFYFNLLVELKVLINYERNFILCCYFRFWLLVRIYFREKIEGGSLRRCGAVRFFKTIKIKKMKIYTIDKNQVTESEKGKIHLSIIYHQFSDTHDNPNPEIQDAVSSISIVQEKVENGRIERISEISFPPDVAYALIEHFQELKNDLLEVKI